jgi:hypothetical protein
VLYSIGGFWFCDALLDEIEQAANQPEANTDELADNCEGVMERARISFSWTSDSVGNPGAIRPVRVFGSRVIGGWLDHLTISRALFMQQRFRGEDKHDEAREIVDMAVKALREMSQPFLASALRLRAQVLSANGGASRAREDLDEAWDIAERGPLRLHMADIHLYRARLFGLRIADRGVRNEVAETYPWESPKADLEAAEKLINDCGYHRRDEELADAKKALLEQELI